MTFHNSGWAVVIKGALGINYQLHKDGSVAHCFASRARALKYIRERVVTPGNYVVRKCTVTIEVHEKGGEA